MDEVDETAISWTLGKMVIEASKAVQPRSAAVEAAWTSHLPQIHLDQLEHRLNSLGIQTVWAYGFMTFFLVMCIFNMLRRRFRWTWSFFPSHRPRARKPSISGELPLVQSWAWPWNRDVEEGIDLTPAKANFGTSVGRMRLWFLRLGSIFRRNIPFGSHDRPTKGSFSRSQSMPLTSTLSSGEWSPPSPRGQFFTPGYTIQGADQHGASASSVAVGGISGSTTPVNSSPPRPKSNRGKPRQSSNGHSNGVPSALALTVPDSSGWNDPPTSMLSRYDDEVSPTGSGVLTPMANGNGRGSRPMSRQSSRVNLSELGLAQRSASRSTTPMGD